MSGTERRAIRAAARAALAASAGLAGFTEISAWVQSVSVETLPAIGVAAPQERRDRTAQDIDQRDLTLVVVVKRAGAEDIEDVLDDDADAIEAALVPALRSPTRQVELSQTDIRVDGDGAQRVGTLTLSFIASYWVDDPL